MCKDVNNISLDDAVIVAYMMCKNIYVLTYLILGHQNFMYDPTTALTSTGNSHLFNIGPLKHHLNIRTSTMSCFAISKTPSIITQYISYHFKNSKVVLPSYPRLHPLVFTWYRRAISNINDNKFNGRFQIQRLE